MKTSIALACLALTLAVPSIAQADTLANGATNAAAYTFDPTDPQPPPADASAEDWTAYWNAVLRLGAGG